MTEYQTRVANVLLGIIACLLLYSQIPEAKKLEPETEQRKKERLTKGEAAFRLLTLYGYHCSQIPIVDERGNDHYGRVQRVWCDGHNSFRITWRTYGSPKVTVAPWVD